MLCSSSWSFSSEKITTGSRMNKCEICLARRLSIPNIRVSDGCLESEVRYPYHGPEGVCKFPGHRVLLHRCTPGGLANCRICTTRQSRNETYGCGICRFLRADWQVRTTACRSTLPEPSSRAPLPYDHRRLRR